MNTRSLIQNLSLAGFLICVLGSYFLSQVAGSGDVSAKANLGSWTVYQYTLAALFMLLVWWQTAKKSETTNYAWIIGVAIIARLVLIPVDTYTSNDTDRYLFDGAVALSGHDPYRIDHNDPRVSDLRDLWPTPEEHTQYSTLYPPGALLLFTTMAAFGPELAPVFWKLLLAVAGIATLLISVSMLKHAQALHHLPLIALSPILVLETGVGGHVDTFAALAVVATIRFWQKNRFAAAGLWMGVGVLFKLIPGFLLIPLWFALRVPKERWRLVSGFFLTLVCGYGVALLLGLRPIGSLLVFFEKWRFGSPIYRFLEMGLAPGMVTICIGVLALLGFVWVIRRSQKNSTRALQGVVALPLLLSPVVFPWYLTSLIPLVALVPTGFLVLWLIVAPVTYEVLNGWLSQGVWNPALWPLALMAIAWMVGLVMDRRQGQGSEPADLGHPLQFVADISSRKPVD